MTINERRKYIWKMWSRYKNCGKLEKGKLLQEMEAITGMHRKSLIRILNGRLSRKKRQKQRGKEYGVEVEDAIRKIARSLDYPCAERLSPNLVWMAEHLGKHGELQVTEKTIVSLDKISVSTLKRVLKRIGRSEPRIAYRKPVPKPRNHLRKKYPMKRIPWNIEEPGHFEMDLVDHGGESGAGEFIHTIQMVDVATGWSEMAAVFGKSYKVMEDGFETILKRLPIKILELHPDNGSEFFNRHILRFWGEKVQGLEYTRSRPYQKNDNRFVEENNLSGVRAYVGHGRFDTLQHLAIMRELYDLLWVYHNFFQPVMRTKEKVYMDEFHYRRVFDQARTPFDRLVKTGRLSPKTQNKLEVLRQKTNPLELRTKIDELITILIGLPENNNKEIINIAHTLRKEISPSVTLSFGPINAFR
ncbi:MAG: hypothetical protein V2I46_05590 [Bacteroides sp.]|nr:hypothetical protein [Bacteroides sp.]